MEKTVLTSVPLPPPPRLALPYLAPLVCGKEACQDLSQAASKEWVVTNGLGGWASSTILGMNTRPSHGLLIAAAAPPLRRVLLFSKVEETLVAPGGRFELSTNRYESGIIHPEGFRYLVSFRLDPAPTFLYQIGDLLLEKTIFLLPGENAVVVGYTLHSAPGPVELAIRPLVAFRDFRWAFGERESFNTQIEEGQGALTLRPYENLPPLMIHHTAELVERSPCWYKSFEYQESDGGGARRTEDLWSPGQLLYLLKAGESCALVASTGRRGGADLTFHQRRLINTQTVAAQTMTPPGRGKLTRRLSWSAESFLAAAKETYLMAGFPGLTTWGRDALIALPGLLLTTQRFDAAKAVLETLGSKVKGGLLPVRFSEEDGSPEYDSADTSLWFFISAFYYMKATKEKRFLAKKLLPIFRQILEGYLEGTHFGIAMGEDGLIVLSDEELPLTWMDGRLPCEKNGLPGPAVTPRFGKPVEVNALWYCALRIMAAAAQEMGLRRAATYARLSRLVRQNFQRTFMAPSGILYDRVAGALKDASIRPNMLIAASLPFSPLTKPQKEAVLEAAERHLVTPAGIRTLSPHDPRYRGRYEGDLASRALSYHQGTIWTWLIGAYVSAVLNVRGLNRQTRESIKKQLSFYTRHLEERGLGSISELFDGEPPHAARGGISQAWSVGEILRAIEEVELGDAL